MKKYSVEITPKAEKMLEKIDKPISNRIRNYINKKLVGCENPRLYGKALHGPLSDKWSYPVGDYRIIAEIEDDKILIMVVDVDHRRQSYRG